MKYKYSVQPKMYIYVKRVDIVIHFNQLLKMLISLYVIYIHTQWNLTLQTSLSTYKMAKSWQKDMYSNVFWPVYNGLFEYGQSDFITDKNLSLDPNVISWYGCKTTKRCKYGAQLGTRESTDYDRLHNHRLQ